MGGQADQHTRRFVEGGGQALPDSGGVVLVGAGNDILVVDDDRVVLEYIKEHLADEGYTISTSDTGVKAVKCLKERVYNLLLVDKNLPDINGLAIIKMCRDVSPDTEAILMTAHASLDSAIEAIELGAYDYVLKPFEPDALKEKVRRAMDHQRVKYENKVLVEFLKKANEELEAAKRLLEEQVRKRTEDLSTANEDLKKLVKIKEDIFSTVVQELKSLKKRLKTYSGQDGALLSESLRREEDKISQFIEEIRELAGLTVVDMS